MLSHVSALDRYSIKYMFCEQGNLFSYQTIPRKLLCDKWHHKFFKSSWQLDKSRCILRAVRSNLSVELPPLRRSSQLYSCLVVLLYSSLVLNALKLKKTSSTLSHHLNSWSRPHIGLVDFRIHSFQLYSLGAKQTALVSGMSLIVNSKLFPTAWIYLSHKI